MTTAQQIIEKIKQHPAFECMPGKTVLLSVANINYLTVLANEVEQADERVKMLNGAGEFMIPAMMKPIYSDVLSKI